MKILCLTHVPFEGPGRIAGWARRRGHALKEIPVFAGARWPAWDTFDGVVVMGGPMSVHDTVRHSWLKGVKRFLEKAIGRGHLVLGVCLGAQLIAQVLGGRVGANPELEIGWFPIFKTSGGKRASLFAEFPDKMDAFHWHGETFDLPPGALNTLASQACRHQAFEYGNHVVGLQFHIELSAPDVRRLVRNCPDDLQPGPFVQKPPQMFARPDRFKKAGKVLDEFLERMTATCYPLKGGYR